MLKSTSHRGAVAELIAAAWLLDLGYEVFRNVSAAGPADLTVWHPQTREFHLIDVKAQGTEGTAFNGTKKITLPLPRDPSVLFLVVHQNIVAGFFEREGTCAPTRHWPLGVCPPALPDGYNEDASAAYSGGPAFTDVGGEQVRVVDLARQNKIGVGVLRTRLKRGMSFEQALAMPVNRLPKYHLLKEEI